LKRGCRGRFGRGSASGNSSDAAPPRGKLLSSIAQMISVSIRNQTPAAVAVRMR
jgi:hypothetical protein